MLNSGCQWAGYSQLETPAKASQNQGTLLKPTALESLGADRQEREANKMRRKRERKAGRGEGRRKRKQCSCSSSQQHCRQAHREPTGGLSSFALLSSTNTKP